MATILEQLVIMWILVFCLSKVSVEAVHTIWPAGSRHAIIKSDI